LIGKKIAHYSVTAKLGEGGMGEVYRATDTKLGRDVALKVLPQAFASDADRMARFEREAQVLASLNHTNIASIYGLEEADGVRCLVLELVEGPTLAERIAKGPIPLDEALPIARQVAEALETAQGIGFRAGQSLSGRGNGRRRCQVAHDDGDGDPGGHHPGDGGLHEPRTGQGQAGGPPG
jgi:serine/threonine protein kinase